jgi:hypothetical protein
LKDCILRFAEAVFDTEINAIRSACRIEWKELMNAVISQYGTK